MEDDALTQAIRESGVQIQQGAEMPGRLMGVGHYLQISERAGALRQIPVAIMQGETPAIAFRRFLADAFRSEITSEQFAALGWEHRHGTYEDYRDNLDGTDNVLWAECLRENLPSSADRLLAAHYEGMFERTRARMERPREDAGRDL